MIHKVTFPLDPSAEPENPTESRPSGFWLVTAGPETVSAKSNLSPAVPSIVTESSSGCQFRMGTDDLNVKVQGGGGGIVGIGLSVAEGDSLGDGDGVGDGDGLGESEGLGEGEGMIEGDATMAGISFALLVVSFRTGSTRGFGLGVAGTTTATEGVDTGLSL
jgi:hypothetical protein